MHIIFHNCLPYVESFNLREGLSIVINDEHSPYSQNMLPTEDINKYINGCEDVSILVKSSNFSLDYIGGINFYRIQTLYVASMDNNVSYEHIFNQINCTLSIENIFLGGKHDYDYVDINKFENLKLLKCGSITDLKGNIDLPNLTIISRFAISKFTIAKLKKICANEITFENIDNKELFYRLLLLSLPSDFRFTLKLDFAYLSEDNVRDIYNFYNDTNNNTLTSLLYRIVYIHKFNVVLKKNFGVNPLYHTIRTSSDVHSKIYNMLSVVL